jgi:hypothetical protein
MATTAGGGCCWVVFEDDIGPWHPERARAHRDIKKTLENLNEADVIVRNKKAATKRKMRLRSKGCRLSYYQGWNWKMNFRAGDRGWRQFWDVH